MKYVTLRSQKYRWHVFLKVPFFSYETIIYKGTGVEDLKENEKADDVFMVDSIGEGDAREMFGTSYSSSEDDDFLKILWRVNQSKNRNERNNRFIIMEKSTKSERPESRCENHESLEHVTTAVE